jgi:hypothetical protein
MFVLFTIHEKSRFDSAVNDVFKLSQFGLAGERDL